MMPANKVRKQLEVNVVAQVAARGQRLGREYNLEIVTFLNEAEADGMSDDDEAAPAANA